MSFLTGTSAEVLYSSVATGTQLNTFTTEDNLTWSAAGLAMSTAALTAGTGVTLAPIQVTFTDNAGQLVNPTAVKIRVTDPAGVSTVYSSPDVINLSTGVYCMYPSPTTVGAYKVLAKGTGVNGYPLYAEMSFAVIKSMFTAADMAGM